MRTWPGSWVLLSLLILAGNNCAPIFLRGLLRTLHFLSRWFSLDRDAIRYALDHPRQVAFTPSTTLAILSASLVQSLQP
jgi:hypothetical protein